MSQCYCDCALCSKEQPPPVGALNELFAARESYSEKPTWTASRHITCSADSRELSCEGDVGCNTLLAAPLRPGQYCEFRVLSIAPAGRLCIGLSRDGLPTDQWVGLSKNTIGYHSDDGVVFRSNERAFRAPMFSTNDVVGVGISSTGQIYFTRNGLFLSAGQLMHLGASRSCGFTKLNAL